MLLALLLSATCLAQTGIDVIENYFGATNVNAITGHGRLMTSSALDARDQERFGAPEGAGLFLGLLVDLGDERRLVWLRDLEAGQSYGEGDGANVYTTFSDPGLGLSAELVDAVHPEVDALVRRLRVTLEEGSPVAEAWMVTYANLSPVPGTSSLDELPFVDWVLDGRNDFAAIWREEAGAVVHLHPEDERIHDDLLDVLSDPSADWGPIGEAMAAGDAGAAAALSGTLDADYGPGAYLALTTSPAPDQHQVGLDGTDWCAQADVLVDNLLYLPQVFDGIELPVDEGVLDYLRCLDTRSVAEREGWALAPADPLVDLADGELSGEELAAGEAASALRTPLVFEGGVAEASVVLGAGATAAAALDAAGSDPAAVIEAAEAALAGWLADKRLPGEGRVAQVARRALINVRVGADAATGAIVASPARQPPYGLDWPRDGAFFNVMLDAAGAGDLVARRGALYAGWQRDDEVAATPLIDPPPPEDPDGGDDAYPADAWEMNYYPDGRPGGNIRFEIDTTAFAVWTLVAHAGWAEDPEGWLRERWDAVRRGCELLARWRDEETGLHAPAQEDDNTAYTQTLHGAVTVFGALDLAARAARYLGEDADAEAWEARAGELQAAILTQLWDEEERRFVQDGSGRAPFAASELEDPAALCAWDAVLPPSRVVWAGEEQPGCGGCGGGAGAVAFWPLALLALARRRSPGR